MGYTHYWRLAEVSQHSTRWKAAVQQMAAVIAASPVPLAGGDGSGTPDVDEASVCFNGVNPDDYETFAFEISSGFHFCKTANRPYDIVVTACLAIAKDVFGNEIQVTSDGDPRDWVAGVDLASRVLGRPIENPIHTTRT